MSQPVIFVTADTGIEDCLRVCLRTVMRHVDAVHPLKAMRISCSNLNFSIVQRGVLNAAAAAAFVCR